MRLEELNYYSLGLREQILGDKSWLSLLPVLLQRESLSRAAVKVYDDDPNLVAAIIHPDNGQRYVVKLFGWRKRLHYYLSPLSPSRAMKTLRTALKLNEMGVATPLPVFFYERRRHRFVEENLIITEEVRDYRTARQILRDADESELDKLELVRKLARIVRRIHEGGIFHRDLTLNNFLVQRSGDVYLVDLNRARHFRSLSMKQRLKDIARMDLCQCGNCPDTYGCRRAYFLETYARNPQEKAQMFAELAYYLNQLQRYRKIKKELRNWNRK